LFSYRYSQETIAMHKQYHTLVLAVRSARTELSQYRKNYCSGMHTIDSICKVRLAELTDTYKNLVKERRAMFMDMKTAGQIPFIDSRSRTKRNLF